MTSGEMTTQCCVVGGGPAGVMLGFLLARAGVDVIVLEKHADFLRDFRGDTVHPSTLRLMQELGLLDDFLKLPHRKIYQLEIWIGQTRVKIADLSGLPPAYNFVAMMPQWNFLQFLATRGAELNAFRLLMSTQAESFIEDQGAIVGVNARGLAGPLTIKAGLVVAADGRRSTLRAAAGLKSIDLGAPMDVLWFRIARTAGDGEGLLGRIDSGRILVRIDRGDYWQCAYVIAKGSFESIRVKGLDAFKADVAALMETGADRLAEIDSFEAVKLLSVAVDRLERWRRTGFLAIGDAAHAMSPVGGVGINLAVQDAVAAANRLAAPLRENRVSDADLAAVENRRRLPTRLTQAAQLAMQNRAIGPTLKGGETIRLPLALRLIARVTPLQRLAGRLIGLGIRPEHVRTTIG
jgi:2-polyprenyl-6-methoxyphenol hydroxylase-like FAD-dependent oxidoreductase